MISNTLNYNLHAYCNFIFLIYCNFFNICNNPIFFLRLHYAKRESKNTFNLIDLIRNYNISDIYTHLHIHIYTYIIYIFGVYKYLIYYNLN